LVFNGGLAELAGLFKREIEKILEKSPQFCKDIWQPEKCTSYISENKNGKNLRKVDIRNQH
jgi:hypothetical protein